MASPGRRRIPNLLRALLLAFLFTNVASAASAVLGIDLGTEYIKAALVKPGIPLEIVLTKDSRRKELSAVTFKPAQSKQPGALPERKYGSDAVALAARFPANIYPNLKSLLGRSLEDLQVEIAYQERYPALEQVPLVGRGTVAFKANALGADEGPFLVEELLGMILQNVRANAEAMAGKGTSIRNAVITVPAFYTADEKRAVELAAKLAGLDVMALVTDGLAVGINYATSRQFPDVTKGEKPEFNLVYDMGAGSTSATILKFQARTVKDVGKFNKTVQEVVVLGTGWDRTLGGDALNSVVLNNIVNSFVASPKAEKLGFTAKDVKSHGRTAARLWKEAERVRQVLSANTETSANFEGLYEDIDFRYKLTRADFEKQMAPFAERVEVPIKRALEAAKLSLADLDSIILHGGAVRTPFVQKRLEAAVGDAGKIRSNVNADEAAVFGAAFKGAGLSPSFRVKEIRTSEGAGYAVGVKWISDGRERRQKVFVPTSLTDAEKQISFKNLEDFSFEFYQQTFIDDPVSVSDKPILKVQTTNLTASVAKLADKFGCAPSNISVKFAVKLSAADGLPEVVQAIVSCEVEGKKGGVVDDVKGFFGFGSKKGEQEPLKEAEIVQSDVSTEEAASSSTSSAKKAAKSADAGLDKKAAQEIKSRIENINIAFTTEREGIPDLAPAELKRVKDRLSAFDSSDKGRLQREEALNTLEAFTYRARDLLGDESFITGSTKEERSKLETELAAASEWLYGDGADAVRDDLRNRLKTLKALVNPIEDRRTEAIKRPGLIAGLRKSLDGTKGLLETMKEAVEADAKAASSSSASPSTTSTSEAETSSAASSDELDDLDDFSSSSTSTAITTMSTPEVMPPLYTVEDVESLSSVRASVEEWLEKKLAEQEKLAPHQDPVLVIKDLEFQAGLLSQATQDMLMRKIRAPKAKGSAKPKTKAKNAKPKKGGKGTKNTATDSAEEAAQTVNFGGKDGMTEEDLSSLVEKFKAEETASAGERDKKRSRLEEL